MTSPISFEFFPPNTEQGFEKLRTVRRELAKASPLFYSVTYGAGGSTQEKSLAAVLDIQSDGMPVAPHLSCIGATRELVARQLDQYQKLGIRRLVALRGDLPSGMINPGEFRYASDLIEFVRQHCADWFHIEVACYPETHPQARSPRDVLLALRRKAEAGANSAITQYFYNGDAFLRFRDRAKALGIALPIVPGIMPITNYSQLARFSDTCGAEIPRWIRQELAAMGDDRDAIRAFGHDVVCGLVARLRAEGVPGWHFYTLNQSGPSLAIIRDAGL